MKTTTARVVLLAGLFGTACSASTGLGGRPGGSQGHDAGASTTDDAGETRATQPNERDDAGGGPCNSDLGGTSALDCASQGTSDSAQTGEIADADATGTAETDDTDGNTPLVSGCAPGIPPTSQIPRMLNREYDAAVRDLLGVTTVTAAAVRPSALLTPDDQGPMTELAWAAYFTLAEQIAREVMSGPLRENFISCEPEQEGCLETTIETFGRKAFRRPLTDDELERFMHFDALEPKGTPDEVAETVLFAFLASPMFILLPELATEADATSGAIALSDHEVATRLSLLVWGSLPDEELSRAADSGELKTAEQIWAQAERMLENRDLAAPQLIAAHRAYAGLHPSSRWGMMDHDASIYPAYSSKDAVNPAMMKELDAFFEEVASDGGYAELFTSNVGFVNAATAPIYGLDAAAFGSELTRVELDASERPGFLTRIAFLSSFSQYDRTAPILRGAYIMLNILDINVGPPPPSVGPAPPLPDLLATNREHVEALTAPPQCAGCHTLINPAGFVLEAYDAVGGSQAQDPMGGVIDPVADVTLAIDDVQTIHSPLELMTAIAQSLNAQRRYAREWVTFATKRTPNPNDECVVDALSEKLRDDSYPIRQIPIDLTQADSFRLRTREL